MADLNHVGGGHVTKRQSCFNKKRNLRHVSSARIVIIIIKWRRERVRWEVVHLAFEADGRRERGAQQEEVALIRVTMMAVVMMVQQCTMVVKVMVMMTMMITMMLTNNINISSLHKFTSSSGWPSRIFRSFVF